MLIPAEQLSLSTITNAKANHLLLCMASELSLFWIADVEGEPFAVFLNGDHARHCFPAKRGANWSGVLIGPVELRIDPASVNDGRGAVAGHLKAASGKLQAPVVIRDAGFNESTFIAVADLPTLKNAAMYFSRWSLGMFIDDEWLDLVTVDGETTFSPLLPTPEP